MKNSSRSISRCFIGKFKELMHKIMENDQVNHFCYDVGLGDNDLRSAHICSASDFLITSIDKQPNEK